MGQWPNFAKEKETECHSNELPSKDNEVHTVFSILKMISLGKVKRIIITSVKKA